MGQIKLTRGKSALVDENLLVVLNNFKWQCTADGYASATIKSKFTSMHRFILGAEKGTLVDHINGDKLDNRRENLRIVTRSRNAQNIKKIYSTTGYKGVCWDAKWNKFRSDIKVNGKRKGLGGYVDPVDAARAYDKAALEIFGAEAATNYQIYCTILKRLKQ